MEKIEALTKFLEISPDEFGEVTESWHSESAFDYGNQEYLVLTESEADAMASEQIKESLWAFDADFLSGKTNIDFQVFEAIQKNERCESNNPAIASIIVGTCGMDSFVHSAISADGRGHFLSSYDGDENEVGEFFIYRTN